MEGLDKIDVRPPPAPLLTVHEHGGLEVSWTPDHYEVQTGGLDAPPVHALKIKVVPVDGADPAAIMVIRATAERARILTGFERGRVEPGVSYVAVCARVSAAGASAYSTASEPAIAAAPVEREAPSRDVDDVAREPVQRVHPKIARARARPCSRTARSAAASRPIRTPHGVVVAPSPRGAVDSSRSPRPPRPGPPYASTSSTTTMMRSRRRRLPPALF